MLSLMSPRFSTRREVYGANFSRLERLPGEYVSFPAADQPGTDSEGFLITLEKMNRALEQQVLVPKVINLKVRSKAPRRNTLTVLSSFLTMGSGRRAGHAHCGENRLDTRLTLLRI